METENKVTGDMCSCGCHGCMGHNGMLGKGMHGMWGNMRLIRVILVLAIISIIFCMGFHLGIIVGGMGGYEHGHDHGSYMMHGYDNDGYGGEYGGGWVQPMMGGVQGGGIVNQGAPNVQ